MSLVIFTTKYDKSRKLFPKSAKIYYYSELKSTTAIVNKDDKVILRDPYNTGEDFSPIFRKLLKKYSYQLVLDKECYQAYLNYEDKLFQAEIFKQINVPYPKTWKGEDYEQIKKFPVIVKKRIGSRGRGVKVCNTKEELLCLFQIRDPRIHLIQEFLPIERELRILVLKDKILGAASKNIFRKEEGNIGVTVDKAVKNLNPQIEKESLKIVEALKADFVGIDAVESKNEKHYFLEANISPQFTAFSKTTGVSVVESIISVIQ